MPSPLPHASTEPTLAKPDYSVIRDHYEDCLAAHGPTPRGVDWPNEHDLETRFRVMLGVFRPNPVKPKLLDLGCGPGLLLDHLSAAGRLDELEYTGLDFSEAMVAAARRRHPSCQFLCRDLLRKPLADASFDYVIMNGVLTEKLDLSHEAMTAYAEKLIEAAFATARIGLAFNAMSPHVDRTRDDLFHWPLDDLLAFLTAKVTRHVAIRADYGLYEFTAYLYREPGA